MFDDPQVLARAMVVETEHPTLGRIRTLGSPVKMSATPPVVGRRAPLLGEHTEEVLREAGCDERLIARADCALASRAGHESERGIGPRFAAAVGPATIADNWRARASQAWHRHRALDGEHRARSRARAIANAAGRTVAPYKEASGCAGLFMYAWNDDRSEVLTIKADRNEFKFPDGETTIDIAKAGPGIAVRVEVTPSPRASLPFCSDEGTKSDEQPKVWVAVAGKVKIMLKRRAGAAFQPVNARVDDLVLRSPEGAEVKQRRDIQFTAAVGDFDK